MNNVFALKAGNEAVPADRLFEFLRNGEARFGWSYVPTADLRELKSRIESCGWASLTEQEQDCYSARFLLDIAPGDWLVYINMPSWGRCAAAQVSDFYHWKWEDNPGDFNHRLSVDSTSVFHFDRNDEIVHPLLRARLKLQGRYWRIYAATEFQTLVTDHRAGRAGLPATPTSDLKKLAQELQPHLEAITHSIHRTHPNTGLECLISETMKSVPGVREVRWQGGAGDGGADIVVIFETGLPVPGLVEQKTCLIQVKSFTGEHGDTRAINDIRRAFARYPEADCGLIVSTASSSTPWFDGQLDKLREELNRPVSLMIGSDVASFFMRFGGHLLA